MERIECKTREEAEKKLWIASKELGEWGEKFFSKVWFNRHVFDNFDLEQMIYSNRTPTGKKAQQNGVDFIETDKATGKRHAYEVKTDLQSTWAFSPNQNHYRTRPLDGGASKLDRTKETINPLMEATTGNEAELRNGLLNYFIELKQEWGDEGWFPKLERATGELDNILPEYAPIDGRDVVFISVIDGEPLEEDKKCFADQDGNLPDGMRSGAGAFIILVPDDVLIRIAKKEKEATTDKGHLLPMYKLFERKEADAFTEYWEERGEFGIDTEDGEAKKKFIPTDRRNGGKPVLLVGKQPNGVTVWPMEPLTITERDKFIDLVETKGYYKAQYDKFQKPRNK